MKGEEIQLIQSIIYLKFALSEDFIQYSADEGFNPGALGIDYTALYI